MENRYEYYLPDTVKELREFRKLAEVEGIVLAEESAAKDMLVKNQWILTAERTGLLRMAKIMGFLGAEALETEPLRDEILYRWNSRSPYTCFYLQDWLDGCLGQGNYLMEVKADTYLLWLVLGLKVKEKKDFLETQLRKIIPANLQLLVELNTNSHDDLVWMTHDMLKEKKWTYAEIPLEDMTPYKE